MKQKRPDAGTFLLSKSDKRPVGKAIWRYTEWELPALLSGLSALLTLWILSFFFEDLSTLVFMLIVFPIYFIVHIAVMHYRKRH